MKALSFVSGLGTEFSPAVLSIFCVACPGAGGTVLLRSQAKSQSHLFPPLKLSLPHSFNGTAPCSQRPSGKKKSHNNAAFKWQLQSWPMSLLRWEQPAALSPSHSHSSKFTPQTLAHIALLAHWSTFTASLQLSLLAVSYDITSQPILTATSLLSTSNQTWLGLCRPDLPQLDPSPHKPHYSTISTIYSIHINSSLPSSSSLLQ